LPRPGACRRRRRAGGRRRGTVGRRHAARRVGGTAARRGPRRRAAGGALGPGRSHSGRPGAAVQAAAAAAPGCGAARGAPAAAAPPAGVAAPTPRVRADGSGAPDGAGAARVLLVEDNAVNQAVATALLGRLGIAADIAADGCIALEMLETGADGYAAVLMDC